LKLRPMLAEELWHLRSRHTHRTAKDISHRRWDTERLDRALAPGPTAAELRRNGGLVFQGKHDLSIRLQRRAQRELERRLRHRYCAGFAERHVRMASQHRQQRHEIPGFDLKHRRGLAIRERFEFIDELRVLPGE